MLVYLDTCIVIYAVEGQAPFQPRAQGHIAALEAAGDRFLVSDLTRGECLVHPLGGGDGILLLSYQRFFLSRNLSTRSLTPSIHDRAARIRGVYRYAAGRSYSLADSLHLATAIESGCDRFLTNDARLTNFPEIAVDILPREATAPSGPRLPTRSTRAWRSPSATFGARSLDLVRAGAGNGM